MLAAAKSGGANCIDERTGALAPAGDQAKDKAVSYPGNRTGLVHPVILRVDPRGIGRAGGGMRIGMFHQVMDGAEFSDLVHGQIPRRRMMSPKFSPDARLHLDFLPPGGRIHIELGEGTHQDRVLRDSSVLQQIGRETDATLFVERE